MAKPMTLDKFQEEMPDPFPRVKKGGNAITPAMREEQYGKILKVGMKLLEGYFKSGDDFQTDLTGYPKTKWKNDAQYQAFIEVFKPKEVGDQSARTRLWDAVKMASQDVWLVQNDLGRLSNIEKIKLIKTPNNDEKIKRCQALLGIKETDEKKKQKQVKGIVEGLTAGDIISALNKGDLALFDSLAKLEPVIRQAEGEEARELLKAFNSRIKKMEKNIIPLLRAMVSMVNVPDEE
jgi:hypothetical protein